MSRLTRAEMETIITFDRSAKTAEVYTADPVMIARLDKLVAISENWSVSRDSQSSVAKTYTVSDKTLIQFHKSKRKVTEAQREVARRNFRRSALVAGRASTSA